MRSKHKGYSTDFKNQIIKEAKETGNASFISKKVCSSGLAQSLDG